jgi:hypothetical protein
MEGHPLNFARMLSTAKVKTFLITLGKPWFDRYLESYIVNKKIQEYYGAVSKKQVDIFDWMACRSRQTLNPAQNRLCAKLWERFSSSIS